MTTRALRPWTNLVKLYPDVEVVAEHIIATTTIERAALKKLVANWRVLIDQRLTADEGMLFSWR